jgi:long-chain acyl-CoA synthetase
MSTRSTTKHLLTEKEYQNIKAAELKDIENAIGEAVSSGNPRVMYQKYAHAVTDLKDMLRYSAENHPDIPLFKQKYKKDEPFREITFRQAYDDVNALGTALIDLGLKDKHIGVIGKNCSEWAETYLAVVGGVGVIVPLDKELHEDELRQLTAKGELEAIITVENKHYEMFKNIMKSDDNNLRYVINAAMDEDENRNRGLLSWNKLREDGRKMVANGDTSFTKAQIINTDLAVILFTSGTTGVSKGVMLNNRNLVLDVIVAHLLLEVMPGDVFFSILPIHHTYECTATFLSCVYAGATMAFCQGLKYMLKDLEEIKPTLFLAVPLIYENFYNKIQKAIREQGKEKALKTLLKINNVTKKVGLDISKKATKQITDTFGGNMRTLISGGAAIDGAIMDFFSDLGFRAVQGYGLTECSPIIALNPDKRQFMKNASAGFLFPLSQCKIVDKDENGIGEICFKGPTVMMGYYKDPENTEAVMKDGWFYTGDLGYLDEDNYVYITGRKKNVIITANGKNVFPEELEFYLMKSDCIEECMVWGDETNADPLKRGIYATIRVNEEGVKERLGEDYTANQVVELINREVDVINKDLPLFKKITHVVVRNREFDKTTAMKIRRFVEDNKNA